MPVTAENNVLGHIKRIKYTWDGTGVTAPGAPTAALAGGGAGNVDNGEHFYKITFVTADGETEAGTASSGVTVTDSGTDGKVALSSIPVSGDSSVTQRKIYRTEAGLSTYKLLDTIADNVTTTYEDNIADSSLGATAPAINTTGNISAANGLAISGEVLEFVTVPDGDNAPTANYDVTITDADGFDILKGQGANRSASSTERVTSGFAPVAKTQLTLTVTDFGDAGGGDVYLYVK